MSSYIENDNTPLQLEDLTVRNALTVYKHKCFNCDSTEVLEYDDEIGLYICAHCCGCMVMNS